MTNTKNKLMRIMAITFVIAEALLFYLIHIERLDPGFSLHYASIIIAAAFSWLTLIIKLATANEATESWLKILSSPRDENLLRIAMLFTLAADYYLVALDEIKQLEGMIFFSGTQFFIFLHLILRDESAKSRKAHIITRLTLIAVLAVATLIVLGDNTDALALISVIYYANLLTSMIFAPRDKQGGKLLALGLLLFALCDINVGLAALNDMYVGGFPEGSILYNLINADVDLAWIFYLPSQTIIPLTLLFEKNKKD